VVLNTLDGSLLLVMVMFTSLAGLAMVLAHDIRNSDHLGSPIQPTLHAVSGTA